MVDYYDKIQLVPFGEYVPMRPLLGLLVNRIVHGFGDMIAGTEQTLFPVKGAQVGVLICYESIFPDLTRRAVKRGADVLVNITNDAWYGKSSAPYQLLAMTAMRAVETKVPIVRAANTGISAVIEADGRITASTPLVQARHRDRGRELASAAHGLHDGRRSVLGDLLRADARRGAARDPARPRNTNDIVADCRNAQSQRKQLTSHHKRAPVSRSLSCGPYLQNDRSSG